MQLLGLPRPLVYIFDSTAALQPKPGSCTYISSIVKPEGKLGKTSVFTVGRLLGDHKMLHFTKASSLRPVLSLIKGAGKLTSLQRATLSSTASQGKLFELRTYNIKPSCMGEYVQLTKDKFHLRTAHSKLVGFWLTELGGVNESVHLWEYDSLAHRASVRAALASDDEWKQQYLFKAFQHLDKQNNQLVKCTWGSVDTTPIQEGGVYQLQTLHLHSAGITGKFAIDEVKRLTSIQEEILKQSQTGKLIAVLSTQIGASDTVHQIWNYKQVDAILKCNEALEKHPSIADSETFIKKTVTKMLLLVPGISLLK